jgi:hypothetical protein
MDVKPYTIAVPDKALEQLFERLKLTTFADQLDSAEAWDVGAPLREVKRLVNYWKTDFDWRKSEKDLNKLPNFITTVDVEGFGEIQVHC